MSRISLTQKFYKEDCLNIIQNLSILQLQDILGVNLNDKNEILEFLKIGLKKEDLNFCLANSLKVIDKLPFREELMNKHKIKKIVSSEYLENNSVTDDENKSNFDTQDENKNNFDIRDENNDENPPPETRILRIISHPDPENNTNFDTREENTDVLHTDAENNKSFQTQVDNYPQISHTEEILFPKLTTDFLEENTKDLWNAEDAEIDCIEYNTEDIDNQYNDYTIQFKKDIQDNIDESIKQTTVIKKNYSTELEQLVKSKATKYQITQALNERNKKLKQQQDIFQFIMKQKLKYQLTKYEKEKIKYSHQDEQYRFKKNHILPLCRILNINYDEDINERSDEGYEKRRIENINEILKNRRKK